MVPLFRREAAVENCHGRKPVDQMPMQGVRSEGAAETRVVVVGSFGANGDSLSPFHGLPPMAINARPLAGRFEGEGPRHQNYALALTPEPFHSEPHLHCSAICV